MAAYPCIACGGTVELDTQHLGPWAAHGLLQPVRIIGDDCVRRLGLAVGRSGGYRAVTYEGELFLGYRGGFAHSDDPRVRRAYD